MQPVAFQMREVWPQTLRRNNKTVADERRWEWGKAFQIEGTVYTKILNQKNPVHPSVKYHVLLKQSDLLESSCSFHDTLYGAPHTSGIVDVRIHVPSSAPM